MCGIFEFRKPQKPILLPFVGSVSCQLPHFVHGVDMRDSFVVVEWFYQLFNYERHKGFLETGERKSPNN